MKSIKFLATLAIPAMFAACTSEDIVVVDTPQMEEIVGADLVSAGVSLNATRGGVDSRFTGTAWESTDQLGLAWVRSGDNIWGLQPESGIIKSDYVFGNDLFALVEGSESTFETKANVYQGYHFLYFPYEYMPQMDEMTVTINKPQTSPLNSKRYNDVFSISGAQFVHADDVIESEQKLALPFEMWNAANFIFVKTLPQADVTKEGSVLKTQAIKSIKVTVDEGKNIFADQVKLNPTNLPIVDEDYKLEDLINALYDETKPVLEAVVATNTIVTDVTGAELKAGIPYAEGKTNNLSIVTIPATAELTKEKVTIEIEAGVGRYVIAYKDLNVYPEAAKNNAAIEALVAAYEEGGVMTEIGGGVLTLDVELYPGIYVTDYKISSYTDWVDCVNLANEVVYEEGKYPTFTLKDGATIEFNANQPMVVPTKQFAIAGNGNIVINGEFAWPTNLVNGRLGDYVTLNVTTGSTLLLDSKLMGSKQTLNEGTIKATANAVINKNLVNKGEIVVEVGTIISDGVSNENLGKISYRVPQKCDSNSIMDLKTNARVNTLVILKGHELDYTSALAKYRLEIYGGSVTVADGISGSASAVTLYGGSVSGLTIDNLYVKADENASEINGVQVKHDITVDKDAELIMSEGTITDDLLNNGTTTIEAETCVTIGNIENNGTLTANTDVFVNTITLGQTSNTTIATNKVIWYKQPDFVFVNSGNTQGNIWKYNGFAAAVSAAANGATVVLSENAELTDMSFIDKGIVIKGASKDKELTLNFNNAKMSFDKPVTFENITIKMNSTYDDGNNGTGYESHVLFNDNVVLKNVILCENVAVAGNATFENVTFKNGKDATSYAMWIAPFGGTVELKGCTFNTARAISVVDGFNTSYGTSGETTRAYLNVSGTTFNTTYKTAIMAGAPVTVNWAEGNVLKGNEDKNNPVWVRYEYWKTDANKIGNIEANCGIYCEPN